mmetsp:Transcript_14357/g.28640  ORF Transcript_14357/g.28640 Transcript_14357/m.28640 type:complete len:348 (+) Transcript_14357:212-1255(+)|eukprot:CAMPEP_0181302204 /NCGR_PEP_ID=MMETSP1101-20121128/7849_1 /TAXON_ID=46948 /ORGANISM="Rhodomonas abbreviata, Strain Caron Lab Isolate" /LENGTH=347 /DNA_ID=CAMNT_0023407593 /DNA_START=212 /DNA_END=1255 /DNA_ORIENTATION=-
MPRDASLSIVTKLPRLPMGVGHFYSPFQRASKSREGDAQERVGSEKNGMDAAEGEEMMRKMLRQQTTRVRADQKYREYLESFNAAEFEEINETPTRVQLSIETHRCNETYLERDTWMAAKAVLSARAPPCEDKDGPSYFVDKFTGRKVFLSETDRSPRKTLSKSSYAKSTSRRLQPRGKYMESDLEQEERISRLKQELRAERAFVEKRLHDMEVAWASFKKSQQEALSAAREDADSERRRVSEEVDDRVTSLQETRQRVEEELINAHKHHQERIHKIGPIDPAVTSPHRKSLRRSVQREGERMSKIGPIEHALASPSKSPRKSLHREEGRTEDGEGRDYFDAPEAAA